MQDCTEHAKLRRCAFSHSSNTPETVLSETVLSNPAEKTVFEKTVFAAMPTLFLEGMFEAEARGQGAHAAYSLRASGPSWDFDRIL